MKRIDRASKPCRNIGLLAGTAVAALLAGALDAGAALAQAPAPPAAATDTAQSGAPSGDIIVTARKRDEKLENVPITISVLSGDLLAQQAVLRPSELQFAVPGFYVQNFETRATITLRGVGAQIAGGTSSVATHINGIYQASSAAQLNRLFDVERVEVLKGPQGTLYGRNSTGGALNIITKAPGDKLEGNLSAGYGTYDTVRLDGGLTVPLSDDWSARVAGSYLKGDGQFTNRVNGHKIGNDDFVGGRFTLAGTVGGIKANAFVQYTRDQDNTQPTLIPINPATAKPVFGWRQTVYDSPLEPAIDRKLLMAGLNLSGPLTDHLSWRSITGYLDYKDTSIIDVNPVVSNSKLVIQTPQQAKQFSQELQLLYADDRFNGVVGLYYLRDNQTNQRYLSLNPGNLQLFDNASINRTHALAAFGDLSYNLTDQLTLEGGLRVNRDRIRNAFAAAGLLDGTPFDLSNSKTSTTFKAGLQYKIREGLMLFGTVSSGFQSGFSETKTDALTGADEPTTVKPERLTAYEMGLKLAMPEHLGYFNISGFYYDYRDLQVSVGGVFLKPDGTLDATRPAFFFTNNAAKARIYGIDAQLSDIRVAKSLKFDLEGEYLNAKYREYDTVSTARAPVSYSGNTLPRAPKLSATSGVTVDHLALGGTTEALFRVEYNYRSRAYFGPEDSKLSSQGHVGLVNALARVDFAGGRWALTANARNLTNKKFFDFYGGSTFGNAGEFRTWEVGANVRF